MTGTEKPSSRPLGVAAGCLLVVIGALLPWGQAGQRSRSSFEIVSVAQRNGFLPDAVAGPSRLWLLAPVVAAVAIVAAAYRRSAVAVGLGALLAAAAVGLAVGVGQSPLVPRYGIKVTLLGAVLVAVDAIRQAVGNRGGVRSR